MAAEWERLGAILREEEDHAYEVFQRLGRWLTNYLETGGRGDPETVERVESTRGREEGLELVALRMLDQGRSVEEIAEITGFSKGQIEGLQR